MSASKLPPIPESESSEPESSESESSEPKSSEPGDSVQVVVESETDLVAASPGRFFHGLVKGAVEREGLKLSPACEAYLVSVLVDNALGTHPPEELEKPFGIRLATAMTMGGAEAFNRFRKLGDDVLFLGGFFSEHLSFRGLPADYVCSLGTSAYQGAATTLRLFTADPPVFEELSARFETLLGVLGLVADGVFATEQRSNVGIVELYERWRRTGSSVLSKALTEHGLVPARGGDRQLN